ncbi:hypothetical protein KAR91_34755 [Candidatus Pacearchaeota archaeon]|nr:hypothetical protein [Candidatus Pacearchaeota archaeon]
MTDFLKSRSIIPPSGLLDSLIALVGEQPGYEEVRVGKNFVGPAGQELDRGLHKAGIVRSDCYITNVFKDLNYPLAHYINLKLKHPLTEDGAAYVQVLKEELSKTSANIIVAIGGVALYALTGRKGIHKWRGSVIESTLLPGRKVIPVIHPATVIPPKNVYLNKHLISYDLRHALAESKFPEIRTKERRIRIKPTFMEVKSYLNLCRERGLRGNIIDIDIEVVNEELNCISFALSPTDAMSIPFVDGNGDYFTLEQEADIMLDIAAIFEDERIIKRGQNFIFDLQWLLRKYRVITKGEVHCTMIAQKISLPDYPVGLDFICTMHTDIPYYKADGKKWLKIGGPYETFWIYNGTDSISTSEAHPNQILDLERQGNLPTYERQRKLIYPLMYMGERGIRADTEGMIKAGREMDYQIKETLQMIHDAVGYEINPNSPQQLMQYFYTEKKIKPYTKRSGNKWVQTTDVNAMKRIARRGYGEAKLILNYRRLTKRKSVYLNIGKVDNDGRYRSDYKPVGAKTGRLASAENIFGTGGNQQNWPHDLLRYLLADEGYIIYSPDLSQIENRIVAYVGKVLAMIEAFETGQDVHKLTAALIFGKKIEDVTTEDNTCEIGDGTHSERFWGKKSNHALNYDEGYKRFSLDLEIPETEGKWMWNRYHSVYPEVRNGYQALVRSMLAENRTVTNLFDRNRLFLGKMDNQLHKDAYAQIPQSTTADKINEQGINYIYYNPSKFSLVELLTQIHDSLPYQLPLSAPWKEHARILWDLKESLEIPLTWRDREFVVPVDVTIGFNMCKEDGIELKHKDFPSSPDKLALKLKEVHDELNRSTTNN